MPAVKISREKVSKTKTVSSMKPLIKKEPNKSRQDNTQQETKGNKNKKEVSRPGAEETLKKAAEEEAERQRVAADEEETRQAAQKAEEEHQRLKNEGSISWLKNEENQKDLINWLRSVPLHQGCVERVDRSFSDGSLLAEVIHHFCPKICNPRQFYKWNSRINKLSNWEALNHKVFPKLGFKLTQKQLDNILNPFHCGKFEKDCVQGFFIYKLLFRIRRELTALNPKVFDYKKPNFEPPSCKKKPFQRKLDNFLDHPPFSKVEWLIEQGFYDREEALPAVRKSACRPTSEGYFDNCNVCTVSPRPVTENSSWMYCTQNVNSCNSVCIQPTCYKWTESPPTIIPDCCFY